MPDSVRTTFDLLPVVSPWVILPAAAAVVLLAVLMRLWFGQPAAVTRRWDLWLIRAGVLAVVLALLLNPVRVQESPGPLERPEVFVLLDASQSMEMGSPATRWNQSLELLREATGSAGETTRARLSPFRFGHRLTAIPPGDLWPDRKSKTDKAGDASRNSQSTPFGPNDPDTQLAGALRRLSTRFGRTPPAGVIVLSDGQARDAAEVERMAQGLGKLKVPVHVVPVGDVTQGGDVAIVGVIAPDRVRKFSDVEVHVFLRSFGFDGRRAELALSVLGPDGKPQKSLASLPVTLQSGIQSATLVFQSDMQGKRLQVSLVPQKGEMSLENNAFAMHVDIERTKIRVLYVEGNATRLTSVRRGETFVLQGPHTDVQEVLSEDPDIECVVLAPGGTNGFRRLVTEYGAADRGFPETVAELSAFDAILLSNVRADQFSEKQLEWIEQWVAQRGAGLAMFGGPSSFAAGGWRGTVVEQILPVLLPAEDADWTSVAMATVRPGPGALAHPIWRVSPDERENIDLVGSIPPFAGLNQGLRPKESLSNVLASAQTAAASPEPGLVVGKYGKGRSFALSTPVTAPWAAEFKGWGSTDRRYFGKFWRNVIYWLTENSSIGRRRLVAGADKRFYRPGETIAVQAAAYDEGARRTKDYRVVAMIEPAAANLPDNDPGYAPIRWPAGLTRDGADDLPGIAWGEEFPLSAPQKPEDGYRIALPIFDVMPVGSATQTLRLELTAYEDQTQVDSTSLLIQVLHDPYELQNPLPNHDVLYRVAAASGGQVLHDAQELKSLLNSYPVKQGSPMVRKSPLWSQWPLVGTLLVLLCVEWLLRRRVGMA